MSEREAQRGPDGEAAAAAAASVPEHSLVPVAGSPSTLLNVLSVAGDTACAEVLHSLQRTAGNRAVTRLIAREPRRGTHLVEPLRLELGPEQETLDPVGAAQRRLDPAHDRIEEERSGPRLVEPMRRLVLDPVREAVVVIQVAIVDEPASRQLFTAVVRQLLEPTTSVRKDSPLSLHSDAVVAAIKDLEPVKPGKETRKQAAQRAALWKERRDRVIEQVFGDMAPESGSQPTQLAAEWERLGPELHKYFANDLGVYRVLRPSVLTAFGALDSRGARERMRAFYAGLVDAEFAGIQFRVHAKMAARLARANTRLEALLGRPPDIHLKGDGALLVRVNHNEPWSLSKHCFGIAIDLEAEHNPNIRGYAEKSDVIEAVTGVDTRVGTHGVRKSGGNLLSPGGKSLSAADVMVEAERLRAASGRFVDAFKDEAAANATLLRVARERGRPEAGDDQLLGAIRAARDEGDKVAWKLEAAGVTLEMLPKGTSSPPVARGRKKPPPLRGPAHDALARMLFPAERNQSGPDPDIATDPWGALDYVEKTVRTLILIADTATAVERPDGKPAPPSWAGGNDAVPLRPPVTAHEPTLGQLAAHGFMNLPPEVVAALAGADGGGLRWLGGLQGDLKDYMHFELPGEAATELGLGGDPGKEPR